MRTIDVRAGEVIQIRVQPGAANRPKLTPPAAKHRSLLVWRDRGIRS